MYKILLTASIKSVCAGSGPYCSDAVLAPFTFHTQICSRRHHTRNHNTCTTTHIYTLVCARCCVDVCGAHIHPKYTHCEYYIHLYKETAAASTNWINKSACGVLAQINTLFFLSRSHAYNKYQSNLWYPKANWALERLLCLLRCVCVLTNGFESDIILHY
jgi:hypothetical protein